MENINCDTNALPNLKMQCVCIGKFDGIHIGHQHLISQTKAVAEGKKCGIITFNPLPFIFFNNGVQTIYTPSEKLEIVQRLGINFLLTFNFNKDLASMTGERFIEKVAKITPNIVVGQGFKFGNNQSCNEEHLCAWQGKYKYKAHIIENINHGTAKVSSGLLREYIVSGKFEEYSQISQFAFFAGGVVIYGRQMAGNILGFPTANLHIEPSKLMPPYGVYATHTTVEGARYKSISNYGIKPSVSSELTPVLESHLLNYNGNLYGKTIKVEFAKHIRSEIKFPNINHLQFQIAKDIEACKHIHNI